MTYFAISPEDQTNEALERCRAAQKILDAAEKAYRRKPSRDNLISLKAAVKLCKETNAMYKEWVVD